MKLHSAHMLRQDNILVNLAFSLVLERETFYIKSFTQVVDKEIEQANLHNICYLYVPQ